MLKRLQAHCNPKGSGDSVRFGCARCASLRRIDVGDGRSGLLTLALPLGRVAEWQTRWLQVPVSERMWGFKSPLAHDESPAQQGFSSSPEVPTSTGLLPLHSASSVPVPLAVADVVAPVGAWSSSTSPSGPIQVVLALDILDVAASFPTWPGEHRSQDRVDGM